MAVAMIGPKFYAWDRNGKPLAFGKLYTYQARTNVPKPTYQSEDQEVENTNPVILNGEGYANVYLSGSYKMALKDSDDNEIWSSDPVSASQPEEWVNCLTAEYLSPTSFKVGGNFTSQYEVGRRVRLGDNTSNYKYSTITSSSFAAGFTTVTVVDSSVTTGIEESCVSIIGPESTSTISVLSLNTLEEAVNSSLLKNGYSFSLIERVEDFGGSGVWDVVPASSVTPNGVDIVQSNFDVDLSFVLRLGKSVTIAQLGGTGETDDTIVLKRAFDLQVKLIGDPDVEYIWSDTITHEVNTWVHSENLNLKFSEDVSGHAIRFLGSATTMDYFKVNGDYHSFCDSNGYYPAPVFFGSPETHLVKPRGEKLLGTQDLFQYAFHVDQGMNSYIQDPRLHDIKIPTATGGGSGFCGGIFYTNDGADPLSNNQRGKHKIWGGIYSDIWTTKNPELEQGLDSDAIRSFTYGYDAMNASQKNIVDETQLLIDGGYFFNVRKSAVKSSYINTTFLNGIFVITDPGDQIFVGPAARCQVGSRFTVKNFTVSGGIISVGVLAAAKDNVVENIQFDSGYNDSAALVAGNGDLDTVVTAKDLFIYGANHAVSVSDLKRVSVDGIYDMTGSAIQTSVCRYLDTSPKEIAIKNVYSDSDCLLLFGLNASAVFKNFDCENINLTANNNLGGLVDVRNQANRFTLKGGIISGGYGAFISTSLLNEFVIDGLEASITGSTNTKFDVSAASKITFKAKIFDNRATVGGIVVKLDANKTDVDLTIDSSNVVSASGYTFPLFITGNGAAPKLTIDKYEAIGFDANQKSLEIQNVNHADLITVDMEYSGGAISLFNSGNSLVRLIKGNPLAAIPVIQSGTGAQTTLHTFDY